MDCKPHQFHGFIGIGFAGRCVYLDKAFKKASGTITSLALPSKLLTPEQRISAMGQDVCGTFILQTKSAYNENGQIIGEDTIGVVQTLEFAKS